MIKEMPTGVGSLPVSGAANAFDAPASVPA